MKLLYSKDNIIYSDDEQRTRILRLALKARNLPVFLNAPERKKFTALPADMAAPLKTISGQIVGNITAPADQAILLRDYFRNNFRYSLSVHFKGDNEGILNMITQKHAAYCTFFATAYTLLLRAQGIPARVATGFMTDEKIDRKKNKFLVRVKDAHAWAEALINDTDPVTGRPRARWQIMDPTPAGALSASGKKHFINLTRFLENIWLGFLRFGAYIENLDKDKLKRNTLLALIIIILSINARKIFRRLVNITVRWRRSSDPRPVQTSLIRSIYRRYEIYLKKVFGEARDSNETDTEVIDRLRERSGVPVETIAKLESFLYQYHAARFGGRREPDLEKIFQAIEEDGKNR